MRKAGFLEIIHTWTWTSVGLTWQMVQRTQTMYSRAAECPIEDDPPAFGGYRGEKTRSLAVLAVRSTHNLIEVVAAGGVTASKSMGRCPISAFSGDLERGYEETIPPRACGRVNTEHSTVGRQSYGVDLDPFEKLAQIQSLGLSDQW